MKIIHNFSKEFVDTVKNIGTTVQEYDENGNIISYYNLPQWFKDVDGHIFECPVNELPYPTYTLTETQLREFAKAILSPYKAIGSDFELLFKQEIKKLK